MGKLTHVKWFIIGFVISFLVLTMMNSVAYGYIYWTDSVPDSTSLSTLKIKNIEQETQKLLLDNNASSFVLDPDDSVETMINAYDSYIDSQLALVGLIMGVIVLFVFLLWLVRGRHQNC